VAAHLDIGVEPVAYTVKHPSGVRGEAIYRLGSLTATYFHSFFPSNPLATAALFTRESP
jgi:cobyrinic acid a,c-diamide synthase